MRIRKHYAKLLLGTGRPSYSPPPSPPPPPFDQYQHFLTHADGGAVCQLNCSPWDVLDFQEEEDGEDYYGFKVGDETEEKGVTTSNVVDKCGDTDRKKNKNKKRKRGRKKRKAKVDIIDENTSTAMVVATSNVVDKCGDTDRKKNKNKKRKRGRKKRMAKMDIIDENTSTAMVVATSNVVDKCGDADQKRKRSRKKREAKVDSINENTCTAMVVAEIIRICSKNNGKGWNCNRPSLPQQTLCDYHFYRLKVASKKKGNISHDLETDPPPPPIYSENNEHNILSRLRKRNPKTKY